MSTCITTSTVSLFRNEARSSSLAARHLAMPLASAGSAEPPPQLAPPLPRHAVTFRAVAPPPDDLPAPRVAATICAVEPPAETTPARPTVGFRAVDAPWPDTLDARLIAILDTPLALGETAHVGYARKEQELGAELATLSVPESGAMHARLANPQHGDELAHKFARLTEERRGRLLSFLVDARRRVALAGR